MMLLLVIFVLNRIFSTRQLQRQFLDFFGITFIDFGVDRLAKVTSAYDIVEEGYKAIDVAKK